MSGLHLILWSVLRVVVISHECVRTLHGFLCVHRVAPVIVGQVEGIGTQPMFGSAVFFEVDGFKDDLVTLQIEIEELILIFIPKGFHRAEHQGSVSGGNNLHRIRRILE